MLFYKLNIVSKATEICTAFNDQVRAEVIPDHNDPYRVDWIDGEAIDDVLIGEKVGIVFLAFRLLTGPLFFWRP
jgi:actin-related protein 8